MSNELKQAALQRYRAILLATIDFLLERFGGSLVYDQYDPIAEYYQQQKLQTQKYFQQRRLDKLQQKLESLTKNLKNSVDLNIAGYIKEKTGYDIDLFEDLRTRVDAAVAQKEISSQEELSVICKMLPYYQQLPGGGAMVKKLNAMITDYAQKTSEPTSSKTKTGYAEVISSVEKDGIEEVTITISKGPKPKHLEEEETISPDGKRKLRVTQWSDGKQASTTVVVLLATASGAIYGTNGICPEIKAWWKDNATIVVETRKEYTANPQYKQVSSFDDVITIEYVERY